MTRLLSVDPGLNTGAALMHYSDTEPLTLLARYQIHGGLQGYIDWQETHDLRPDEVVVERFVFDPGADAVDLAGVPIEGVIALAARRRGIPVIWHTRADKSGLTGYPAAAKTKAQRQRVRFDWLASHGLYAPGTENDDTNDAVTHGVVLEKRRGHRPTIEHYWPNGRL